MNNIVHFLAVILLLLSCGTRLPAKELTAYAEGPVNIPVPFAAGIISTKNSSEFDLCLAQDGRTVYFTRRTGNEKQKIWTASFRNNVWTTPEPCSFSTDRDESPSLAPDGKTLYFGSTRPIAGRPSGGSFDMNIWRVERSGNQWVNPTPLGKELNAVQQEKEEWPSSNESFLFIANNSEFLYTTMLRGTASIDIYQTSLVGDTFTRGVKVEGLLSNPKQWKSSAIISPDGRYLFFNSYGGTEGFGGEDIYVSRKTKAGWSQAKNIGPLVNTKTEEANPRFSPDGRYFFFGREIKESAEKDGVWDIYFIETKYLNLERLFDTKPK